MTENNLNSMKDDEMQVGVWDTYVVRKDGRRMHFDIIAPNTIRDVDLIHSFGRQFLESKGELGQRISSAECVFCHIEAVKPEWLIEINRNGYFIFEMQNCD